MLRRLATPGTAADQGGLLAAWQRRVLPRSGRRAVVSCLLAVILVVAAIGRLDRADSRVTHTPSADQRAYLRLAHDLRATGTYGDRGLRHPFHWAPGTPVLFEAADAIAGTPAQQPIDQRAARRAQAVVGTLTVLAAFALATVLAGSWAGLAAALVVALYPPLVDATASLVSEPLGALAVTTALASLAWAWRGPPWRFLCAGVAFGLACLVRADVLAAAVVIPIAVGVLAARRRGWRAGASRSAAMLLASLAVVGPWSVYASSTARSIVPVTDGGESTLFIATYLPGHGTVFGMKHALAAETRHRFPYLRHQPVGQIPASKFLAAVAARRPGLTQAAAMRHAVTDNLRRYALGRPIAFGSMLVGKLARMWGGYDHGTHHRVLASTLWIHRAVVLLALAGILAGFYRSRSGALGLVVLAILVTTALDVFFVAEPRHAIRLLPGLVGAGAAGWWLAGVSWSPRHRAPPEPSPRASRSAA
jgi:4-amino-4-deoxy-L-arabinose transferase-like glycosyltransferase